MVNITTLIKSKEKYVMITVTHLLSTCNNIINLRIYGINTMIDRDHIVSFESKRFRILYHIYGYKFVVIAFNSANGALVANIGKAIASLSHVTLHKYYIIHTYYIPYISCRGKSLGKF